MSSSMIFFLGSVVFSLILLWYLQRRAYNRLLEEGYSPISPISRTDGARFLWFCITIIISKKNDEIKPNKNLLITLWLFVMSYPVIIILLVVAGYLAGFF